MDYNFDKLKISFDNILKELDDIYKSIDNLNDFEQGVVAGKPPISTKQKHLKASWPKKQNLFRKCRLPDDRETTPLLSNIIGSAQECTAKFLNLNENNLLLPMETKSKINQNQEFADTKSKSRKFEDVDFLSENERFKIASFYSSVNCFVYVSRCTAELYELKRQDEFDSVDTDPVKDYYLFLKNRQNNFDQDNETKPIVNFMYINSGVPVLIFNSGKSGHKTRKKNLRIVLAERSTAFCMYEFKFNCLEEFENSEFTSVFRLSQTSPEQKSAHFSPSSTINLNYQNEFFEKYFSVKRKQIFKEHFLKFSIREPLDEFYSNLKSIVIDKKNPSYHYNNFEARSKVNSSSHLDQMSDRPKQSRYRSTNSLNSVLSVIDTYQTVFANQISSIESPSLMMCHFSVDVGADTKAKSSCASLGAEKLNRSPLLEKHSSLPSNEFAPFNFDKKKYALRRQNNNAHFSSEIKPNVLSKSVFNLEDIKFLDNGKNMFRSLLVKNRKFKKSDISDPVNFSHVSHLDKPVAIGKRYKVDY